MLTQEREKTLQALQERLGYQFRETCLLNQALTHRSYLNERDDSKQDNERLEFLGDVVISLIVSTYLMECYPEYREGQLSRLRAAVVSKKGLALLALKIDLGESLLLGKGEVQTGGKRKDSIIEGSLEALVGAIYLEAGIEATSSVFWRLWEEDIQGLLFPGIQEDFKSRLQTITQEKLHCVPDYKVLQARGPAHQQVFEVELSINGRIRSLGYGKSKKKAEQEAAKVILERLKQEGQLL